MAAAFVDFSSIPRAMNFVLVTYIGYFPIHSAYSSVSWALLSAPWPLFSQVVGNGLVQRAGGIALAGQDFLESVESLVAPIEAAGQLVHMSNEEHFDCLVKQSCHNLTGNLRSLSFIGNGKEVGGLSFKIFSAIKSIRPPSS
jgi:hypothetical protein